MLALLLTAHLHLHNSMFIQGQVQGQGGYGASSYGYGKPLCCDMLTFGHNLSLLSSQIPMKKGHFLALAITCSMSMKSCVCLWPDLISFFINRSGGPFPS